MSPVALHWPWALLCWPLIGVVFWRRAPSRLEGLRLPWGSLALWVSLTPKARSVRWRRVGVLGLWTLLILSLARPVIQRPPSIYSTDTRPLYVLLDLSPSMKKVDVPEDSKGLLISRFEAEKRFLSTLAENDPNQLRSLIVFSQKPYWLLPPSRDSKLLKKTLDSLSPEALETPEGRGGSAILDALGALIQSSKTTLDPKETTPAILFSDGEDTASYLNLPRLLEASKSVNLRVDTILIGPENSRGEAFLRALSGGSGGRFFKAPSTADLMEIEASLSKETKSETLFLREEVSLGRWGVLLAFLLGLGFFAPDLFRRARS